MKRRIASLIGTGLLVAGCGPKVFIPAHQERPAQIVVSAYTQDGCLEALNEEARERGVEAKLVKVDTDLGWEIFLFPFYKGYRCTGEVIGPAKSEGSAKSQ